MKKKKAVKSAVREKSKCEDIHIGDIAIDSGRMVVADPIRIVEVLEQEQHRVNTTLDHNQARMDGTDVFNARKDFSPELNMGIGVVFPTGLGDGIYPVIAHYTTSKAFGRRIMNVTMFFENPMRGSGCANREPHRLTGQCFAGSV